MKVTNKVRGQVIVLASKLRTFVSSWSEALQAAWKITKMFLGIKVDFAFNKVDTKTGELIYRPATGVSINSLSTVSKGFIRFTEMLENGKTQPRSFRIERLIFN